MDFGHARRFATREARRFAGDLYPGPVLMPRGLLRALDPLLATALGPAREGRPAFRAAFEEALRGRPDGPLLLALSAAATAGEIPHPELRQLMDLMERPMPADPPNRGELLAWLHPRASAFARLGLRLSQRLDAETLPPAERLACGLVLVRILCESPRLAAQGVNLLPLADLERCGLTREEWLAGVRTPAFHAFLSQESAWASEMLEQGVPVCARVGSRLRRGLRAAILRSRRLLAQLNHPRRDPFRAPPRLSRVARWRCAVRAWRPLRDEGAGWNAGGR